MKETEGLINEGLNSTPEEQYGKISQGTDYSGLLNQDSGLNGQLSYGDQALSSAIKQKYSQPFKIQQQGLENKMHLDARRVHQQKLMVAHNMANEEANLNFQKELVKYKQKKAKQAQRQQLIGSVLGLVGGVVGFAAGGPQGAGAGLSAGSAVGNVGSAASSGGLE